ncbi:DUF4283 domain-containing protein [Raphanus sativus]|nr:DUF4283 domain-containing protein [Raphanus sativus]
MKRIARLKQKEQEEVAAREVFSAPLRGFEQQARLEFQTRSHRGTAPSRSFYGSPERRAGKNILETSLRSERTEIADLRNRISTKRDALAKNVWKRLDHNSGKSYRDPERYHPYNRGTRDDLRPAGKGSESFNNKSRYGDSDSSSSWRVKGHSPPKYDRNRDYGNGKTRDTSTRPNRGSPDSQRTISEAYRHHSSGFQGQGRNTQHRQVARQEWRPTRSPEQKNDRQERPTMEQEVERSVGRTAERTRDRETEEERIRRIKGKAKAVDTSDRAVIIETSETTLPARDVITARDTIDAPRTHVNSTNNLPGNQALKEKEKARDPQDVNTSLLHKTTGNTSQLSQDPLTNRVAQSNIEESNKQGDEEDQNLMTTEEMNQYLDQYASVDIEMDENMLDDDDLLDEMEEEEKTVPETQEVIAPANQIKAKEGLPTIREEMDKAARSGRDGERRVQERTTRPPKDLPAAVPSFSKRRGARSPDSKGLAASKKLASIGKASPKGKMRTSDDGPSV